MNSRKCWKRIAGVLAAACLLFSGCGSSNKGTKVVVALNAGAITIVVNQTFQFSAVVTGATDTSVTWTLTSTTGASTTATACSPGCGTLDDPSKSPVTYTAPSIVPDPVQTITITATAKADSTATAKATITLDSGIRVTVSPLLATVGTDESFLFKATTTNDSTPNDVNWLVTQAATISSTAATCSPACGMIAPTGVYTAPTIVPSTATATVVATAKLDASRFGQAKVTIVTAVAATFTGINPRTAPQGGIFQDIYLDAGNLRSTSTVRFNGVPVNSISQLKVVSASLTRLRLNDLNLRNSGAFTISIDGATPPANNADQITIVPVRPALISSVPDSTLQSGNSGSVIFDGGYYGPAISPIVSAQFDGDNPHVVTASNARQLAVTLNAGDLSVPGLFSVSVVNNSASPKIAAANFAVQPDPSSSGPSVTSKVTLPASSAPSAIAVDTAKGIAIVANTGLTSVQRISLTGAPATLGPAINVGGSPTGVAVDEERDLAAVVNNTGKSVVLVDLVSGGTVGTPVDLSSISSASPFSVGLDPTTGFGLVAFSSTNIGVIFNYNSALPSGITCIPGTGTAPYCVIGAVTLNTGAKPQIAFQPRLRWAFVTPGGAGLLSVVDLGTPQKTAPITAATGAKRTANIVTITTSSPHGINSLNAGAVLISGVADTTFNGSFTVSNVAGPNTFTYSQTAADATSGGGQVNFSEPLLTFSISGTDRGIAINPQTDRAVITDANSGSASFLNTLDQSNAFFALGHPATGAAFQPFTNVAVVVKPGNVGASGQNTISLIDATVTSQIPSLPRGILAEIDTQGTNSVAVAVDPPTNRALVANSGSDDISVIDLGGAIHSPQVSSVLVPLDRRLFPQGTLASSTPLSVKIFGTGFSSGPLVRLDGAIVPGASVLNDREIDVTIPALFLGAPRRFALDVVSGSNFSNVTDFTVVQSIDLTGACASAPLPGAVAIDEQRDLAIVANLGCNNITVIDLNSVNPPKTVSVGTAPAGVAVIPRLGLAVVANSNVNIATGASNGAGTASIVDLTQNPPTIKSSPSVGTAPSGVAINQETARAFIVNNVSNTLSSIDLTATTPVAVTSGIDQRPISLAIDPDRNIALVGAFSINSNIGVLDVVDISGSVPTIRSRISASANLPTGVVFDPANTLFYAVSSLSNSFQIVNPDTPSAQTVRVGVNPTSLAYNYHTGTLLTVNSISNTFSFVDVLSLRTRATIAFGTAPPNLGATNPQFAAAIHTRTNLAVITDAANGRVLLLQMPR